jgi:Caspase domain
MSLVRYVFRLFLIFFLFLPSAALSKDARGIAVLDNEAHSVNWGNYHALIIGINRYKEWNPLKTAVKDARELRDVLVKRYGFAENNVILRTDDDATRRRIIRDLRGMATNLKDSDNLLVYYAGHGQLDDITGDGYWIPVEGKLDDSSTWISQYNIKSILSSQKFRGKNIVLVADSCYSGSMLRGGSSPLPMDYRGYRKKLEIAAARRSRQVITSGGVEPVADGGQDGHSLFAYYFLKALKENNREVIDIENLFHTRVWKYVTEIGDQRPTVGRLKTPMDDGGQYVLIDQEIRSRNIAAQKRMEQEKLKAFLAEKEKLEAESKRLLAEKQLLEQRKRLEIERRQIEEEKQKIALASLESQRQRLESEKQLQAIKKAFEEKLKQKKIQKSQPAPFSRKPSESLSGSRSSLAIFPSKLSPYFEEQFIKGTLKALNSSERFYTKLTYYDAGNALMDGVRINPKILNKKYLTPDVIKKMWIKKSFFSKPEPNVEFICKLGRDLQVDTILLCRIEGDETRNWIPRDTAVFLINTNNKKLYSEKLSYNGVNWNVADGIEDVKRLTESVLNDFAKDKSQNLSQK